MSDNLDALKGLLPRFVEGIGVTLQLSIGGIILAFILASLLGLAARFPNMVVRGLARSVIEVFRGTSLVVQLFFFFYVAPIFFPDLFQGDVHFTGLVTGILALGLNYGAYGADVVRGAIEAVPKGQWEASIALSLSPMRRMFRIVWPQAWSIMIPSLSNLGIMLIKGTAVAYIILMHDITFFSDQLRQRTNDTFFSYGTGMIAYLLIALLLVVLATLAEARAKHRLGQESRLSRLIRLRPASAKAEV